MEITGADREIDDITDNGNKNGGTFLRSQFTCYVLSWQLACQFFSANHVSYRIVFNNSLFLN